MIVNGLPSLSANLQGLGQATAKQQIMGALVLASAAVSGYHGFKRNQSVWGGVLWFFLGSMFPVITPIAAIALKPGFGKAK